MSLAPGVVAGRQLPAAAWAPLLDLKALMGLALMQKDLVLGLPGGSCCGREGPARWPLQPGTPAA